MDSVHTNAGDDSVTIKADVANGIYTGLGSDALTIDADVVSSIYTGATAEGQTPAPKGPDDDAVAIWARSVGSVYTGAGNDAVAIPADFISSIYTGEDDDSLSITAGAVSGVHTGDGNDAVVIDAVLGSSQGYGWNSFGQGPLANAPPAPASPTAPRGVEAAKAQIGGSAPVESWSEQEIAAAKAATAGTKASALFEELKTHVAPQIAEAARAAKRSPEGTAVAQNL